MQEDELFQTLKLTPHILTTPIHSWRCLERQKVCSQALFGNWLKIHWWTSLEWLSLSFSTFVCLCLKSEPDPTMIKKKNSLDRPLVEPFVIGFLTEFSPGCPLLKIWMSICFLRNQRKWSTATLQSIGDVFADYEGWTRTLMMLLPHKFGRQSRVVVAASISPLRSSSAR